MKNGWHADHFFNGINLFFLTKLLNNRIKFIFIHF